MLLEMVEIFNLCSEGRDEVACLLAGDPLRLSKVGKARKFGPELAKAIYLELIASLHKLSFQHRLPQDFQ
jgi:hypothetical protein